MKHIHISKRIRRITALVLVLSFVMSLAGCGRKQTVTGQRTGSIFDLFDDGDDPFEGAVTATEEHTGDSEVDPPFTEDTETPSTEDTTQPATEEIIYADVENEEFKEFCDQLFEQSVTADSLTYKFNIKNPGSFGIDPPEELTWGDTVINKDTLEGASEELEEIITWLEELDVNTLTEKQRFDYDYFLDRARSSRVKLETYQLTGNFTPMRGLQSMLTNNLAYYPFNNKQDVEDYINLILLLPDYVQKMLKEDGEKVEAGYGPQDRVLDEMIEQCDTVLQQSGDDIIVTRLFEEALEKMDFLTDAEKEEYSRRNKEAVEKAYIPAYENMKSTFESWKGRASIEGGLCKYGEQGKALYEYLAREYSGSSKKPDELVRYLSAKMEEAQTQSNILRTTDPDGFQYYVDNNETMYDYLVEQEPKEIVEQIMESCKEEYPETAPIVYNADRLTGTLADLNSTTVAFYRSPHLDDPDGNMVRFTSGKSSAYWSTVAHESFPGHMYQNVYYMRTNPEKFRLMTTDLGYMEGWAVYSAYQAAKYCDFNGNEYALTLSKLSQYEEEIGFILYGFVDIAVNYLGWSLNDVKDFFASNNLSETSAVNIYTVVLGDPGLYLSYSVGYYEMLDLRSYAEEQLGDKFDVVEYHKAILEMGPCKYDQLKKQVDKYIAEHK